MAWPAADQHHSLIDVPIPDLHVTAKGRDLLAGGEFDPELASDPLFDPELARDLLAAVAWFEDNHGTAVPR
jgi:hypothetical protein